MSELPGELAAWTRFDWDEGNVDKNWERHGVTAAECEQVFFQRPILIARDPEHSQDEERYAALGKTVSDRRLTVVFTIRDTLIRVISARAMSRRERRLYDHP